MARPKHCVPSRSRPTVRAPYREAKRPGAPMARPAGGILADAPKAIPGWGAAVRQQRQG